MWTVSSRGYQLAKMVSNLGGDRHSVSFLITYWCMIWFDEFVTIPQIKNQLYKINVNPDQNLTSSKHSLRYFYQEPENCFKSYFKNLLNTVF